MSGLAEKAASAANSLGSIKRTYVVVSSDHGSTKLGSGAKVISVPPSAVRSEAYRAHRRFLAVEQLDSLDDVEWFRLRKADFGLPCDIAVSRGLSCIDSKPRGFTHGGLLPEETVVPLLVFESGVVPKEEILRFTHVSEPLLKGKPQSLGLSVRNTITVAVTNLEVFVPDGGGHWKLDVVPGDTELPLGESQVTLPAKTVSDRGIARVQLTATFRAGGVSRSQVVDLPVRVRELYSTELDEMGGLLDGV